MTTNWLELRPDEERLQAQEDFILSATEQIHFALQRRGISRAGLASALGVSQAEVSQRLSGRRNLTLRSLADIFNCLDFDVRVRLEDRNCRPVGAYVSKEAAVPLRQLAPPSSYGAPRHLQVVGPAA